VSAEDREAEVTASACGRVDCEMCSEYIATGNRALRPATRAEYRAGLEKSYPGGIPDSLLPKELR
jgi:hypothetical protein